jgi:outer membrane protein
MMKLRSLFTVLAAVATVATLAAPAMAQDTFKRFQVKVGVSGVLPDEGASIGVIGGDVEISDEYVPSLQLEYFFTPSISTELLCCFARHDVAAVGTALGRVDLGKITHFPPTVTVKYHFNQFERFKPYVGAGVNYTTFFDEDAGAVTSIDYGDSFGPALQIGADIPLNDTWSINLDVRKIWIQTDVTIRAGTTVIPAEVDIDPIVVTAGVGFRF